MLTGRGSLETSVVNLRADAGRRHTWITPRKRSAARGDRPLSSRTASAVQPGTGLQRREASRLCPELRSACTGLSKSDAVRRQSFKLTALGGSLRRAGRRPAMARRDAMHRVSTGTRPARVLKFKIQNSRFKIQNPSGPTQSEAFAERIYSIRRSRLHCPTRLYCPFRPQYPCPETRSIASLRESARRGF
jgi:hypothetical protein